MPETLYITPSDGQSIFNLPVTPDNPSGVEFFVNTIGYINGVDYEVTGNMVVWKDVDFSLDPQDQVKIVY